LKSIPQVLKEIDTIAALGAKYISFSDANLIGNQKFAEQLLEAIAAWSRKNNHPIQFSAEMTITVAERPKLLELLREANFTSIFVGIESPASTVSWSPRSARTLTGRCSTASG
jgi:radical SAM superfamily enzyme YgiQ (UPF0313 family)